MIIAALDTGMRQGEMLALRFGDIEEKRQLIVREARAKAAECLGSPFQSEVSRGECAAGAGFQVSFEAASRLLRREFENHDG